MNNEQWKCKWVSNWATDGSQCQRCYLRETVRYFFVKMWKRESDIFFGENVKERKWNIFCENVKERKWNYFLRKCEIEKMDGDCWKGSCLKYLFYFYLWNILWNYFLRKCEREKMDGDCCKGSCGAKQPSLKEIMTTLSSTQFVLTSYCPKEISKRKHKQKVASHRLNARISSVWHSLQHIIHSYLFHSPF